MKRLFLALALLGSVPANAANFQLVTPDLPPWGMESDGKPAGLGVELMQAMAQAAHRDISIQVLPMPRVEKMAAEGGNIGIAPLGRSPERAPRFRWIAPLVLDRFVVFAKADSPLKTMDDCRGQAVGLKLNGPGEGAAREHGFERTEAVSADVLNAKKLLNGRIGC